MDKVLAIMADDSLSVVPKCYAKGANKNAAVDSSPAMQRVTRLGSGAIKHRTVSEICNSAAFIQNCIQKRSLEVESSRCPPKRRVRLNGKVHVNDKSDKVCSRKYEKDVSEEFANSQTSADCRIVSDNCLITVKCENFRTDCDQQEIVVETVDQNHTQVVLNSPTKNLEKIQSCINTENQECSGSGKFRNLTNQKDVKNSDAADGFDSEKSSQNLTTCDSSFETRWNFNELATEGGKLDNKSHSISKNHCNLLTGMTTLSAERSNDLPQHSNQGLDDILTIAKNSHSSQNHGSLCTKAGEHNPVRKPQRLRRHDQQNFRCEICKLRYFETDDELNIHLECHVGKRGDPELYQCRSCSYSAPSWNRILSHIIVHTEYKERLAKTRSAQNILGKFSCPECGQSFERKVNMQGHLKKVHFKENHTCDHCGITFHGVDRKTFTRHQEKCQNITIECNHCSYTTTVKSNMQKHMKVHNGEGLTCETCSAVFPTRQRYQVHLLTHQTDRPRYGCEYCGMMFVSEDSVKKHCARFHQDIQNAIPCPHCPYVARIKTDLKKHIQAVHEKKYKCTECSYSTNFESAFEQHQAYHSSDRVFACSVSGCFYRSLNAKQMALHSTSVHKTVGKHQCPVCQKFYKKKTHLLRHLVSHTNEKPYMCQECGESFFSHSSYYRHRRRLGHDENREGVASVPQNITIIQYLDDDGSEKLPCVSAGGGIIETVSAEVSQVPVPTVSSIIQVLPVGIYNQLFQAREEPSCSSSVQELEVSPFLQESNQELMTQETDCDGNGIVTSFVEVKNEPGGLGDACFTISEHQLDAKDQGLSNAAQNGGVLLSEIDPSSDRELLSSPQYALVVLPKEEVS